MPFLQRLRRHSLAFLALFVALGGGAYAAGALPVGSVGNKQLKKNAVTSPKVKDGSLLARDFAAGELPGGLAGPAGPAGPGGAQGERGAAGSNGGDGKDGTNGNNGLAGMPGTPGTNGTNGTTGMTGMTGTTGTNGTNGTTGPTGTTGPSGTAVETQARQTPDASTEFPSQQGQGGPPVTGPPTGGGALIPMSSDTWSQDPNELNLVYIRVTGTSPATCATPLPGAGVTIDVQDGTSTILQVQNAYPGGAGTGTFTLGPVILWGESTAQPRDLNIRIWDSCGGLTAAERYTFRDTRADVIAFG
jgi:hypothetical protein